MTATVDDTTDAGRKEKSPVRGTTTVSSRALGRLVSAVAADALGVTARDVRVNLSDSDGLLAIRVRTGIRSTALLFVRRTRERVQAGAGTLVRRAADAQTTIRERVTELTGAEVAHVLVHLTDIDIREEKRVV